jgi:hypothetical protein
MIIMVRYKIRGEGDFESLRLSVIEKKIKKNK